MLDTRPGSLTPDTPLTDLGPLAWVFEELRKSLDAALENTLKAYVKRNTRATMDLAERLVERAMETPKLKAVSRQFWQQVDPGTGLLVHDFTDPEWDTRFLGDLYQDLSEATRKRYALLQTPEFVDGHGSRQWGMGSGQWGR